jgi:hypothetical protein
MIDYKAIATKLFEIADFATEHLESIRYLFPEEASDES